jgi:hypothetical protein
MGLSGYFSHSCNYLHIIVSWKKKIEINLTDRAFLSIKQDCHPVKDPSITK